MKDDPDPKDCPDCGYAVSEHVTACPRCGTPLAWSKTDPETQRIAQATLVFALVGVIFGARPGELDEISGLLLWGGLLLLMLMPGVLTEVRQGLAPNVALPYGINLTECQDCGHTLSLRAAACPGCGVASARSKTRRRALVVLGTGLGLFALGPLGVLVRWPDPLLLLLVASVGLVLFLVGAFLAKG